MDVTTRIQIAVVRADMAIMTVFQNLPSIVLGLVLIWIICKIVKGVINGIKQGRSN